MYTILAYMNGKGALQCVPNFFLCKFFIMWTLERPSWVSSKVPFWTLRKHPVRGDADKSLARPTSRCRRAESIVTLERGGLFMCRIASLFLLQWMEGSMSGDACDFNNIETRAVNNFFPPPRQGAEENSLHSVRTIRGICIIICHCQKPGGPI